MRIQVVPYSLLRCVCLKSDFERIADNAGLIGYKETKRVKTECRFIGR